MRTYAVIIAGGVGSRMGEDIPKQFIEIYGRPVLGYTLVSFQRLQTLTKLWWCASKAGKKR